MDNSNTNNNVETACNNLWPHLKGKWTGKSNFHVSKSGGQCTGIERRHWKELLKTLTEKDFCGQVFNLLTSNYTEVEWFLNKEEFTNLMMASLYKNIHGEEPTMSDEKMVNPFTHNQFYKIGAIGNYFIGIRFWLLPSPYQSMQEIDFMEPLETDYRFLLLRWRVRIARNAESNETLRVRSGNDIYNTTTEIEAVQHQYLDIAEPLADQTESLEVLVEV